MTKYKNKNENRIDWVDISKGLGIILVIIGHCVYLGGLIHNWIFSFHMPLFFILSGIFIRKIKLNSFIKKRFLKLIIPYMIFCIIGLILTVIIPEWREKLNIHGILADIYLGCPDNINVSSVWFLMALFFALIIFQLCLKLKKIAPIAIILLSSVGFLMSYNKIAIVQLLPGGRMPLDIDVSLVALMFLAIGYYGKVVIFELIKILKNRIIIKSILCVLLFVCSVFITILNGRVNIHELTFNNLVLYIFESCIGSFLIILISDFLCNLNNCKKIFLWLGKNSLKILGVQSLLIRLYIILIEYLTGIKYSLYFFPLQQVVYSCIFVISFSVIIVLIFNLMKDKITYKFSKKYVK